MLDSHTQERKNSKASKAAVTKPHRRASRAKSAVSTQEQEDRRRPSVAAQSHSEHEQNVVQPEARTSMAASSSPKSSRKSKSKAAAEPEKLDPSSLATSALGGNFGIF